MSGSGRCPTRPLPRRVRPAARRRHASTRFLDSSSKPTRVTFARFGTTTTDIPTNMRLAADGTECRQRSIDWYRVGEQAGALGSLHRPLRTSRVFPGGVLLYWLVTSPGYGVAQMLRRDWHEDVPRQFPTTRKRTRVCSAYHRSSVSRSLSNQQGFTMNCPAQESHSNPGTTPTVLVVEDEPAIREVVADLLKDEGYTVRQASDGLQAIDEMEVDDVDLVLSDVRMPRLDGPSLARRLRGHGYAVPVVLMSAVDVKVDLPGVRFLPKPFDRDHLLHVIGSALGAYR